MNKIPGRVVVGIYVDPDFYPPTINAILNLAEAYEEVIVISRNNTTSDYPYPSNVHLKKIGKIVTVRDLEKQSLRVKAFLFLKFTLDLLRYSGSTKTKLIELYDPIALFGFYLIKEFINQKKKKIWYHNHDMPSEGLSRQFSVGGLAAKYEKPAMKSIDFFSLPSQERTECYPRINNRVKVFVIPNFPSLKLYHTYRTKEREGGILKIIFQGFIGRGLGLENIIELLPFTINGKTLQLILKGSIGNEYKHSLNTRAEELKVSNNLIWLPIGPYNEMFELTSSCDIGIGINMNTDIISETLGTASNKIYEYAASGLPVLLTDNAHYRKYLDKYEWAFFSDGSVVSLKENIELISKDLPYLKKIARHDFEQSLNFETVFQPVLHKVIAFDKPKY